MSSAVLRVDYNGNLDKPFLLIERNAHCGGTEYDTICRLTESHARLLSEEGIRWLYGEPDWVKHYRKMEILLAERDVREAEKRLAALKAEER